MYVVGFNDVFFLSPFYIFLFPAQSTSTSRPSDAPQRPRRPRVPRRVLHFSDGVIEEYSTDEEEEEERKREEEEERMRRERALVDPGTLSWIPWVVHHTWAGGARLLEVCDSVGERLAWWLGITSPK